jgi:hypothetical protein
MSKKIKAPTMVEYIDLIDKRSDILDRYNLIIEYAEFIKTPFKEWMFVPCGEVGEVLEEPSHLQKMQASWMDNPIDDNFYIVMKFQEAKLKCWFEGWKFHGYRKGVSDLSFEGERFTLYNGKIKQTSPGGTHTWDLEDFIKDRGLFLTESKAKALKVI